MATINELKELAICAVKGEAPSNYSLEDVKTSLAEEIKAFGGSINNFKAHKYDIYEIVIAAADEILPRNIIDSIGEFAEVRVAKSGEKILFESGLLGKNRAKKFLTQVGAYGVYETFRLDRKNFSLEAHAVGGGVSIDLERWVDGAESLNDLMDILTEGLTNAVYCEVQRALVNAVNNQQATNKVIANGFDPQKMMKLINIVKSYADNAVIYAPPEFIGEMYDDLINIVPSANRRTNVIHQDDIDAIHNTGYIKVFRGTPVVQMPQSFVDENNQVTWIHPQFAYIFPAGREKIVKVLLEGPTVIRDYENRDGSIEIYAHKRIGAAIMTYNNWCIYQNCAIGDTWNGFIEANPTITDTTYVGQNQGYGFGF